LGIDEHKKDHSEYRSWEGLRIFFSEKLNELENLSQTSAEMSADDLLQCKAFRLLDEYYSLTKKYIMCSLKILLKSLFMDRFSKFEGLEA
jgi:hypothetical protein